MGQITYSTKNPGKIVPHKFSLDQIEEADDNSEGYCLACGEGAEGVEPDARKYHCSACGHSLVYGAQEIALMGLVS